jgi:hypothetical protein
VCLCPGASRKLVVDVFARATRPDGIGKAVRQPAAQGRSSSRCTLRLGRPGTVCGEHGINYGWLTDDLRGLRVSVCKSKTKTEERGERNHIERNAPHHTYEIRITRRTYDRIMTGRGTGRPIRSHVRLRLTTHDAILVSTMLTIVFIHSSVYYAMPTQARGGGGGALETGPDPRAASWTGVHS